MTDNHVLWNDDYPLSSKYDPGWIFENQMGPNALWLTEWLCQEMDLQPGMRVLDMGCGKALSSILLAREFEGGVPEHLTRRQRSSGVFWAQDCWCFHTAEWWRHLWGRTGLVDVEMAEAMPDGWRMWLRWERALHASEKPVLFPSYVETLEADGGRYLGFVRMVGRRKRGVS